MDKRCGRRNGVGMIEQIVMVEHAVETLGYFSRQLAAEWSAMGIPVYFVDYDRLVETTEGLYRFIKKGCTALCTFNFIGISGEEIFIEENGKTIWENYEMPCFNLMVDHPLYYHKKLEHPHPGLKVFCVDREHVSYMKRFYPEVEAAFLPLAGNELFCAPEDAGAVQPVPYEKRAYDIVFTGNYTPVEHLYREIDRQGAEYRTFYYEIMEDMKAHPAVSIDAVLETHIRRDVGEVSTEELRAAIAGMVFIDICMRSYFRGEIIKSLVEEEIPVHVFGANWDKLDCKKKEYLIPNGREVDSLTCARAIADARISLNIMPWFKDGAHDRVFTAMLQHTLSLTDDSRYLWEIATGGKELVYYSLEQRELLPELARNLLAKPEACAQIAENGYRLAAEKHTWRQRAGTLAKYIIY